VILIQSSISKSYEHYEEKHQNNFGKIDPE